MPSPRHLFLLCGVGISALAAFCPPPEAMARGAVKTRHAAPVTPAAHPVAHRSARANGIRSLDSNVENISVTTSVRQNRMHSAGAVTSISGAEIRSLNLNSPKQIAGFVPGLSAVEANSGSTPIFTIRGVGLDDFNGSNMSGIGVFFDGIYSPYPVLYSGQMLDVQSVDVLKGPQGFTGGRSTTGGSIDFQSVKPTEDFGGYLTVGFSSYDTFTTKGAVNGTIAPHVTNRFAFSYRNGDGWQHDLHNGNRYGASDLLAIRNMTRWEVSDRTSLLFNIHYTRNEGVPNSPQNIGVDRAMHVAPGTYGVPNGNAYANAVNVGNLPVQRHEHGGGAAITLTHNFDFATLTSTSSVDAYQRDEVDNYDGSSLRNWDYTYNDHYFVQSQDVHLAASHPNWLRWTAGLFESFDHVDGQYTHVEATHYHMPEANFGSNFRQQNVSFGAYFNTISRITSKLHLILSGRYSYDQRSYYGGNVDYNGAITGRQNGQLNFLSTTQNSNRPTGRAGLEYQVTPNVLVYGTISNGYKPGAYYNGAVASQAALAYVRPESLLSYEVGAKAQLFDHKLSLEGSLYDYEYHNRQTLLAILTSGGVYATLGNIPHARSRGGELQGQWHTPVRNLDLSAGFAYMDAQITHPPSSVRGLTLLDPVEKGTRLPYAPRFSWDAIARYKWALGSKFQMMYQVSYTWKDNQIISLGDSNSYSGKNQSMGMRLALRPNSNRWELAVYVDNLLDNHSVTYAYTTNTRTKGQFVQTPRWVGGDLTWNF